MLLIACTKLYGSLFCCGYWHTVLLSTTPFFTSLLSFPSFIHSFSSSPSSLVPFTSLPNLPSSPSLLSSHPIPHLSSIPLLLSNPSPHLSFIPLSPPPLSPYLSSPTHPLPLLLPHSIPPPSPLSLSPPPTPSSLSSIPLTFAQAQHLTTMSIEIHIHTRGKLRPDPSLDPVLAIFYYVHNDWPLPNDSVNAHCGALAIDLNNYPLKTIPKASPLKNRFAANQSGSPVKGSPAKGTPIKASPVKGSPIKGTPIKASPAKDVRVTSPSTDMTSMLNEASNGADRKYRCPHPPPHSPYSTPSGNRWEAGDVQCCMTVPCVDNRRVSK